MLLRSSPSLLLESVGGTCFLKNLWYNFLENKFEEGVYL